MYERMFGGPSGVSPRSGSVARRQAVQGQATSVAGLLKVATAHQFYGLHFGDTVRRKYARSRTVFSISPNIDHRPSTPPGEGPRTTSFPLLYRDRKGKDPTLTPFDAKDVGEGRSASQPKAASTGPVGERANKTRAFDIDAKHPCFICRKSYI